MFHGEKKLLTNYNERVLLCQRNDMVDILATRCPQSLVCLVAGDRLLRCLFHVFRSLLKARRVILRATRCDTLYLNLQELSSTAGRRREALSL